MVLLTRFCSAFFASRSTSGLRRSSSRRNTSSTGADKPLRAMPCLTASGVVRSKFLSCVSLPVYGIHSWQRALRTQSGAEF